MRGYLDDEEFLKYKEEKQERRRRQRRIIIYILIIILILLSLITSCSCSGLLGKIGNVFENEGNYEIDSDTDDRKVQMNQDLKFDTDYLEIKLSDDSPKLGFSYTNIDPKEFTCITSNAEIATCYVKDDYVVLIPKQVGEVTVYVQTVLNNIEYKASAVVKIQDIDRFLAFESKGSTLNLTYSKTKYLAYTLVGLTGDVSVRSSDEAIAKVSIVNNKVKVVALKPGTVKITISLEYKGVLYEAEYTLKVVEAGDMGSGGEDSPIDNPNDVISDTPGNTPGDNPSDKPSDTPGSGDNPEPPSEKDSDSSLKSLTISDGTLNFNKNNFQYTVYLPMNVSSVTLEAIPTSQKANVTYRFHDQTVSSLEDLELENGNNLVTILVTAEDGSTSTYFVVIKKCYLYPESYQKDISLVNGLGKANVLLHNNIFDTDFKVETKENGIRLVSKENPQIYIDLMSNDSIKMDVKNGSATSAIPVALQVNKSGNYVIQVQGYVNGVLVNEFELMIRVSDKYKVVLDGNGGFYNELTTSFEFLMTSFDTLDLSQYYFYKVDDTENCYYYTLESFNTKKDGTGKSYSLQEKITDFKEDLTLYAIYSGESQYIELEEHKLLYLVDVPLFYNKEAEELYNDDHLIYPGAQGYYVMNIKNNRVDEITLTGMNLEEDTICIPDKGCLNMGYAIRYASSNEYFTYYYGGSLKNKVEYTILNKDNDSIHTDNFKKHIDFSFKPIKIAKGETVEVFLLWKWVEVDDQLDTLIGNKVNTYPTNHDLYKLTVSIEFDTRNTYCK